MTLSSSHPPTLPRTDRRAKSIGPTPRGTAPFPALAALALAVVCAVPPPTLAADAPHASLTVTFQGLKSQDGMIMLSLSASPDAFAGKAPPIDQAGLGIVGPGGAVSVTFHNLKPGAYAIRAFHDLNGDGKLNTNPFGMPTEPYAFSNNAQGAMGPPAWEAATFTVRAGDNRQTIDID